MVYLVVTRKRRNVLLFPVITCSKPEPGVHRCSPGRVLPFHRRVTKPVSGQTQVSEASDREEG